MADSINSSANPLAWVNFRMNGGLKRLFAMCGIYAAAMIFLNVFIYRAADENFSLSSFAAGSLNLTLIISAILLVFVGSGVINKFILRDYATDMITSHRCSAMSGKTAVIGYLTGPTLSIIALSVVNWFACTILAGLADYPWFAPSAVFAALVCLSAVMWTGSVLAGLAYRGKVSFAALMTPLSFIALLPPLREVLMAHPGLALLLNYKIVYSLTGTAATGIAPEDAMYIVISMLFQLLLALTFFIAASRRYLRDDVTAFNPVLAYALLALFTLICAVGLNQEAGTVPRAFPAFLSDVSVQMLSTVASLALLAILPVSNAAWNRVAWSRRKSRDSRFAGPRPRSHWEAAFAATLVVFGILALVAYPRVVAAIETGFATAQIADVSTNTPLMVNPPAPYGMTGPMPQTEVVMVTPIKVDRFSMVYLIASFFLGLLAVGGLVRFTYPSYPNGVWIIAFFLVATWVLPLVGDVMQEYADERPAGAPKSMMFAMSPLGMWVMLLRGVQGRLLPGLIVQGAIAAGLQLLARRAKY